MNAHTEVTAAARLKTMSEIDSDVCDLRKRSEVLMNLIDAFEESIHILTEKGSINPEIFNMAGFDLVAFQANEVFDGLKTLEGAMEVIAAAS